MKKISYFLLFFLLIILIIGIVWSGMNIYSKLKILNEKLRIQASERALPPNQYPLVLETEFFAGETFEQAWSREHPHIEIQPLDWLDPDVRRYAAVIDNLRMRDGIKGTIKNLGHNIITEIEITFYFFDSYGDIIFEIKRSPIRIKKIRRDPPLKPNEQRNFVVSITEDIPNSWNKQIKAEVTNIKFEEE